MKQNIKLIKRHLYTPMFLLYDFKNIDDIKLGKETAEGMKDIYSLELRKGIYSALQWAEGNPNFQFEENMKDTPVVGKLKFSNEEIYDYLMYYKAYMENEEYGLLTDDRPTNPPWERE